MANIYNVISSSYFPGVPGPDPLVTIVGTVDTSPATNAVPVTVQTLLSNLKNARAISLQAVKNVVAGLMLQQYILNLPPAPVAPVELPNGTFTQ